MLILGIETSCDETAAAVVEDGQKVLSNVVVSQIDIFAEYGGVIPEVAARNHLEVIMPVIHKALKDADKTWDDIDAIGVTHTPGLLGSLLIGTLTARTLAILYNKPLYAVHHLKSHIYANWLEQNLVPIFPLLSLVVSGGHTQILYMKAHNHFEIIGTTRDDAVGECFDKVAKILGLPYPGGPAITKAASGEIDRITDFSENVEIKTMEKPIESHIKTRPGSRTRYKLPHPAIDGLDFSFSGLKTAVLRAVQKELNLPINHPSYDLKNHLTPEQIADFAASFEQTAVDILLEKLEKAYQMHPEVQSFVVAGGVSANSLLRQEASKRFSNVFFPTPKYSGDNGAMVAAATFYEIKSNVNPTDPYSLNIAPRSPIH